MRICELSTSALKYPTTGSKHNDLKLTFVVCSFVAFVRQRLTRKHDSDRFFERNCACETKTITHD